MKMGIARTVGALIVAFVFLLSLTPLLHFFIIQTLDNYVVDTVLDNQTIQQSWQTAVNMCNSLKPADANWTCEERLANWSQVYGVDLNYTGYTAQGSPFMPFTASWYQSAFNPTYLMVVAVLSLVFAGIAEAGGLK